MTEARLRAIVSALVAAIAALAFLVSFRHLPVRRHHRGGRGHLHRRCHPTPPGRPGRLHRRRHLCTAWRSLAEHVAELAKGDRVLVHGSLRQRSWQTEDGERRSSVEVQAEEVGPSLRWATAKPQRTRRTGDDPS